MGLHFVGKWRNEDTASVWCLSNQTKPTHRRSPLSQWAADQRLPIGPFWQLPNGWQSSPHALKFASTRYLVRSVKKKEEKTNKTKRKSFPFLRRVPDAKHCWKALQSKVGPRTRNRSTCHWRPSGWLRPRYRPPGNNITHERRTSRADLSSAASRRHKIAHFHRQSFTDDRNVPANISSEHIHNQHDDRWNYQEPPVD